MNVLRAEVGECVMIHSALYVLSVNNDGASE